MSWKVFIVNLLGSDGARDEGTRRLREKRTWGPGDWETGRKSEQWSVVSNQGSSGRN